MRAYAAALLIGAILPVCTIGAHAATPTAAKDDAAMRQLAADSGCMTCHHIDPGAKGPQGLAPIGPAWREVAARYKGQKDAQEKLTHTVLTGSNPYESHWKGKASGLAMPPNAVVLKEPEARKLVAWILSLPPSPAR